MTELGDKGMFSPQMDFDIVIAAAVASVCWLLDAQRVGLLLEGELRSVSCREFDETGVNSMTQFRADDDGCSSPGRLNECALERDEGWSK